MELQKIGFKIYPSPTDKLWFVSFSFCPTAFETPFSGETKQNLILVVCEETLTDSYYGGWPRAAARILSQ